MPQPVNDPFIEAIVERIRDVISRQSLDPLDAFAQTLHLAPADFRELISNREQLIDVAYLVDVVAAFAHGFAVDSEWLLTGHYNAATHREALTLGEDGAAEGTRLIREFVCERFEKLRSGNSYLAPTLSKATR